MLVHGVGPARLRPWCVFATGSAITNGHDDTGAKYYAHGNSDAEGDEEEEEDASGVCHDRTQKDIM